MVITVTLNPSMDRTLEARGFYRRNADEVFQARLIRSAAGGKGINVSRALKILGGDTMALTLLGGGTGRLIAEKLFDEGIDVLSIEIRGESRTCLGIIDPDAASETILNESGPAVSKRETGQFMRLFKNTLSRYENPIVVLAGSAPPGFESDVYRRLAAAARGRARVVIDLNGDNLRSAIEAVPFMVKINAAELENFTGGRLETESEIFDEMERIAASGVKVVVVTRGPKDALAVVRGPKNVIRRWSAGTPPVEVASTWGSGDCVTAGMVRVLAEAGRRLDDAAFNDAVFQEALMMGMAAGAANALSTGAGQIDPRDVKRLLKNIPVRRL